MKTQLQRIIDRLCELCDQAEDDELRDELDNAVIHLEAASDRLIALEEAEDNDE